MKLGELKKSLSRFSEDMDESEVLFTFLNDNNTPTYDNLAFVAYAEIGEHVCIVLGSTSVAIDRIKKGTLRYPDGTKPTDTGFSVNDSES